MTPFPPTRPTEIAHESIFFVIIALLVAGGQTNADFTTTHVCDSAETPCFGSAPSEPSPYFLGSIGISFNNASNINYPLDFEDNHLSHHFCQQELAANAAPVIRGDRAKSASMGCPISG
jgi:hypothetical protein